MKKNKKSFDKRKFMYNVLFFIVVMISAFVFLYMLINPIAQDAYKKGYERCMEERGESTYDNPIVNPFGRQNYSINLFNLT